MSKPKQWKQQREMKHADVWDADRVDETDYTEAYRQYCGDAYPQEAEPDGRLWVGSGDSQ